MIPLFLEASEELDVSTMAGKLSLSGEMLVRGLGTVFMVLVILWGILSLFNVIFGAKKSPAKEAPKKPPAAPKKPEAASPAPVVSTTPAPASSGGSDDGALIAAITAAIEAYRAEEGTSSLPFRVVSFKRRTASQRSSGWNANTTEN